MITRQQFRLEWGEGTIPPCVEKLFQERDAYREVAINRNDHKGKRCDCENDVDAESARVMEKGK